MQYIIYGAIGVIFILLIVFGIYMIFTAGQILSCNQKVMQSNWEAFLREEENKKRKHRKHEKKAWN